jgi:hypothetical protein
MAFDAAASTAMAGTTKVRLRKAKETRKRFLSRSSFHAIYALVQIFCTPTDEQRCNTHADRSAELENRH